MSWKCLVIILAILVGVLGHKALTRSNAVAVSTSAPPLPARRKSIYHEVRLPRFEVENLPIREALEKAAEAFQVGIAADWQGLDYNKTARVTLHLRDVSLEDAAEAITYVNDRGQLRTRMQNGVLLVIGEYDDWYQRETRVYDIRDLINDYIKYDVHPAQLLVEQVDGAQPINLDDYRVATVAFVTWLTKDIGSGGIY